MPIYEIIKTSGVPVKIFTDQIDAKAKQQLIELAESGLVVGHVAAMPDVHLKKIIMSLSLIAIGNKNQADIEKETLFKHGFK